MNTHPLACTPKPCTIAFCPPLDLTYAISPMHLSTEPHVLVPLAWACEFRARPVRGGGYQVKLPPLHKFGTGLGVYIREVDVPRLEYLLSEDTARSRFPESSGRSDFVFDIASNL